ncbi:MAG TPA: phospholipase D-like domain-containing protein, partial [Roseimicrobium sp.]|nr:phospholipase D-like domain-containing protein [Roseimicrobium sp.]
MKDHEVRESLRSSLNDGQLDKAERDGFRDWVEKSAPDGHKRALYQSMAFELAGEALSQVSLNQHSVLNWLERIVKILTPLAPAGPVSVYAEACFSPGDDCASRIIHAFNQARRSVDVCVFTITDDRISSAMEVAKRRGVKIRLITDNEK